MAKLGFVIPDDLENKIAQYIPWGSKGVVIEELLWQLVEKAEQTKGQAIYDVIMSAGKRMGSHRTGGSN